MRCALNGGKGLILCHIRKVVETKNSPSDSHKRSHNSFLGTEEEKQESGSREPGRLAMLPQLPPLPRTIVLPRPAMQAQQPGQIVYMRPISLLINGLAIQDGRAKGEEVKVCGGGVGTTLDRSMKVMGQIAEYRQETRAKVTRPMSYVGLYQFLATGPPASQ